MTKQERCELYRDILSEQGHDAAIDDQGDVVFEYEGGTYFVQVSDDEMYFRLIYPNFWPLESDEERKRVRRAALTATAETKVAKVFPVDDNVWATIEMFCSPPEVVAPSIPRALSALRDAVTTFQERMEA